MNPFKFIKNQIRIISNFLKLKTMLDLTSWVIFSIAIAGFITIGYIWLILKFDKDNIGDILTIIVLWITAVAIFKYTRETRDLKDVSQKQLKQNRAKDDIEIAPVIDVNIDVTNSKMVTVKNNGKGVAKNIRLKFKIKEFNHDVFISTLRAGGEYDLEIIYQDELYSKIGELDDGDKINITGSFEDYLDRKFILIIEGYGNGKTEIKTEKPKDWSFGEGIIKDSK